MQAIQPGISVSAVRKPLAILVAGLVVGGASAQGVNPVQMTSMDLETALMAVQGERAQLLEAALKQQLQEVQAKNGQAAKLNGELAALLAQRAELEGGKAASTAAQLARLDSKINSVKQQISALTAPTPEEIAARQKIDELLRKAREKQTAEQAKADEAAKKKEQLALLAQQRELQRKLQELEEMKGAEKAKQAPSEKGQPMSSGDSASSSKEPSPPTQSLGPGKQPSQEKGQPTQYGGGASMSKDPSPPTQGAKDELQKIEQQFVLMLEQLRQLKEQMTQTGGSASMSKNPDVQAQVKKEEMQKLEQQLTLMQEKLKQMQKDPNQQKLLALKQQELLALQQQLLKAIQEMEKPAGPTVVQGPSSPKSPSEEKKGPGQPAEETKPGPEELKQKQLEKLTGKGDPGMQQTEKPGQTLTQEQQKQLVQLLQKVPVEQLLPLVMLADYAKKGGSLPNGLSSQQLDLLRALGQLPPDTLAQLQTKLLSQLPPEKRAELMKTMATIMAKLQQQQALQKVVEEKKQKAAKNADAPLPPAATTLSKLDALKQTGAFESARPQDTLGPDMTRQQLTELLTQNPLFGQPQPGSTPWTGMPGGAAAFATQLIDPLQTTLLGTDLERQSLAVQSASAAAGYPYIEAGNVLSFWNWPTTMEATYNGRVSGTLNSGAAIGGNINMTVNFAQLQTQMTPAIPGSITFDNGKGGMSFNLVQSDGYVGNGASGTYNGQAVTGYIMDGRFYGPQAQEIGGRWSMQNAGATLTANGNFAAKR